MAGHHKTEAPELGQDILAEHVDAGIDIGWCTADAVYGRDRKLREYCEGHGIG
jgi:SRSO17 transposase